MLRHAPRTMGLAIALFSLLVAIGLALWLPDAGALHGTADGGLGAALLGGAVVALVVFLTGQESRLEADRRGLAQSLIARFSAPEVSKDLAAATAFLQRSADERARWATWHQLPHSKRTQIVAPLNVLESVGTAYVSKEADRAILRSFFRDIAPALWDLANWFVVGLRVENPRVFEDWERMVIDMRRVAARRPPLQTYEPDAGASDSNP